MSGYSEPYRKGRLGDLHIREYRPPARNRTAENGTLHVTRQPFVDDVNVRPNHAGILDPGDSLNITPSPSHHSYGSKQFDINNNNTQRTNATTLSRNIETPVDPTKCSSADRKQLLLRRIAELEETDNYINTLQAEMAATAHQRSRASRHGPDSRYDGRSDISDRTLLLSPHNARPVPPAEHPPENGHGTNAHLEVPNVKNNNAYAQSIPETYVVSSKKSPVTSPVPNNDDVGKGYGEYRYLSDVRTRDVQNVRKSDRRYRTSVLDKAEQLLKERERKNREFLADKLDVSNAPRRTHSLTRNRTYTTRPGSRSPLSDSEIVQVPETLDSSAPSPIPTWTRKSKRSDIPSAAQVCHCFINFDGRVLCL